MVKKTTRLVVALFLLASMQAAMGEERGPQPPCNAESFPAYPAVDELPVVHIWHASDLASTSWVPPVCTGWPSSSKAKLIVALAGTFRFQGTSDELLARIGAISALRTVRYWSVTDKAWRPFALDASALSRADPASTRGDFTPAEMTLGTPLHYWTNDSRSGSIVSRMQVRDYTPTRVVMTFENVSPIRFLLLTIFKPGALQSVEFIERRGPNIWSLYLLTRVDDDASMFALEEEASYINRAVALYRETAGIQTDQEPPAAR